jgi:GH43 family beta-xylosidase
VTKHDGKYYCFYSGANWQTPRYGVDYVMADKPLGPYTGAGDHARVLHGVPAQVIGPGGNALATGPDGKTQYIIYHAWNKAMTERQLCIDPLNWTPDGPRATATVTPQVMQ